MYQQLLTEASIEKYEKLKVKYREVKELLSAKEKLLEDAAAQEQKDRRNYEVESEQMRQELTRLSSLVAQREHEARDERSKLHQRIEELERDLRQCRTESEDQVTLLRTDVSTLTSQLNTSKQDAASLAHSASLLQEQLAIAREQVLSSEADADSKMRECRDTF